MGSVEEKREYTKEDNRKKENDIFKRSNKTYRSPKKKGEKVEDTVGELIALWRRKMEEVIKKLREMKEEIKEQERELRRKMEEMRREFRKQKMR